MKCFTHLYDRFHMFSYWYLLQYATFRYFRLETSVWLQEHRGEKKGGRICPLATGGRQIAEQTMSAMGTEPLRAALGLIHHRRFSISNSPLRCSF